jgi:hypothetical protein
MSLLDRPPLAHLLARQRDEENLLSTGSRSPRPRAHLTAGEDPNQACPRRLARQRHLLSRTLGPQLLGQQW